jgi:cardiolipin synthase (CMP-forming)
MTIKPPIFALNIPNLITILRILLGPLFVILLLRDQYMPALLVFTTAGISDGLDGFIARYYNQRTVMGAYLDPIADKLLLMAAYITMAVLELVPEWLTIIVISRDVMILTGIAIFTLTKIKFEVRPSIVSKFTTFTQIATIFVALLSTSFAIVGVVKPALFWITVIITIISGLHYIYKGVNILQEPIETDTPQD